MSENFIIDVIRGLFSHSFGQRERELMVGWNSSTKISPSCRFYVQKVLFIYTNVGSFQRTAKHHSVRDGSWCHGPVLSSKLIFTDPW